MVRQQKSSNRRYARMAAQRNRVKCSRCGNETSKPAIIRINGVTKWVCQLCKSRHDKQQGVK